MDEVEEVAHHWLGQTVGGRLSLLAPMGWSVHHRAATDLASRTSFCKGKAAVLLCRTSLCKGKAHVCVYLYRIMEL